MAVLLHIVLPFRLHPSLCAALEADGSSDEIDVFLRKLFADQDLVNRYGLMSLNSVNWSRILVQLAHFIYAYLQLSGVQDADGDALPTLEVVVPTGGAGNITGTDMLSVKLALSLWFCLLGYYFSQTRRVCETRQGILCDLTRMHFQGSIRCQVTNMRTFTVTNPEVHEARWNKVPLGKSEQILGDYTRAYF